MFSFSHTRRLVTALLAQVVLCCVCAPVLAAQQAGRAATSPSSQNDSKPLERTATIQAALDASNCRPDEDADARERRGFDALSGRVRPRQPKDGSRVFVDVDRSDQTNGSGATDELCPPCGPLLCNSPFSTLPPFEVTGLLRTRSVRAFHCLNPGDTLTPPTGPPVLG